MTTTSPLPTASNPHLTNNNPENINEHKGNDETKPRHVHATIVTVCRAVNFCASFFFLVFDALPCFQIQQWWHRQATRGPTERVPSTRPLGFPLVLPPNHPQSSPVVKQRQPLGEALPRLGYLNHGEPCLTNQLVGHRAAMHHLPIKKKETKETQARGTPADSSTFVCYQHSSNARRYA